jgi:hypothetical protein
LGPCILTLHLVSQSLLSAPPVAAPKVDFARDIRPILSNYCFHCHGPDEKNRKGADPGGLRLDVEEGARRDLGGYFAVQPNHPEKSALLQRILSDDKEEVMPPPKTGKRLTKKEISLLTEWIQQGASYAPHWAYSKPQRIAPPAVPDRVWGQHPIDRFLWVRMQREGLKPNAQADRATLARRAALDLIGVPPTPAEVEALAMDPAPDAFSKYVDRLLARPEFGEHWARLWLDLARYADSAGFPSDPGRSIWAYRDYVIRSFNQNKPFDQFTVEQLAGDLLPNPSEEQLIATAFHRNTLTNNEGGTVDEEFRNAAVIDRVNTTWSVWMGSSMACAQCHTHKFDPLTQKEYFQFFAILNQTEDADRNDEAPLHSFYLPEELNRKADLEQKVRSLEERFRNPSVAWLSGLPRWIEAFPRSISWEIPNSTTLTGVPPTSFTRRQDGSFLVDPKAPAPASMKVTMPLSGPQISALRIASIPEHSLPGKGAGLGAQGAFELEGIRAVYFPEGPKGKSARYLKMELTGAARPLQVAELQVFSGGKNVAAGAVARLSGSLSTAQAALAVDGQEGPDSIAKTQGEQPGDFLLVDLGQIYPLERIVVKAPREGGYTWGGSKVSLLDDASKVVWSRVEDLRTPEAEFEPRDERELKFRAVYATASAGGYEPQTVVGLRALNPEKNRNKGWSVPNSTTEQTLTLILDKPMETSRDGLLEVTLEHNAKKKNLRLASFSVSASGSPLSELWSSTPPTLRELITAAPQGLSPAQKSQVQDFFLRNHAPEAAEDRKALTKYQKELEALKPDTVPILREIPPDKARVTKIQLRGNYLNLGEEVRPGIPAIFPSPAEGATLNRLAMARWLMSPENPLTARVTANRFWEALFGVGIVRTSEEFGAQGEMPVHPDLLDWLATELLRSGWDIKSFLKLLVTSAAYQQTSTVTDEGREKDLENRFLSRGPRFRATGEVVRDQALSVSGLLSRKMFGKPVRPAKPSMGLSTAFGRGNDWVTSEGEDRYRRAIYTEVRRNSPYPSFTTFDAPNREVCTIRRNRTNTPLQAFVTLNDPVYIEAAQAFARRIVREGGTSPHSRIHYAYQLALSRPPADPELASVVRLLEQALSHYSTDLKSARSIATEPLGPLPPNMEASELAAWTTVCNVIMNLDEFLMRR